MWTWKVYIWQIDQNELVHWQGSQWVDIINQWSIFYKKISQNGDMIYLRTWKCVKWEKLKMRIRIKNILAKMSMHFLVAKCVMLQTCAFQRNFVGRYFGRYNAVWSIFGRYMIKFCCGRYPIQPHWPLCVCCPYWSITSEIDSGLVSSDGRITVPGLLTGHCHWAQSQSRWPFKAWWASPLFQRQARQSGQNEELQRWQSHWASC